ncbi:MAG: hypothetical protein WD768_07915 [Phycisphaeraceae bacterium]
MTPDALSMTTFNDTTSLDDLAQVLRSAALLSHHAWQTPATGTASMPPSINTDDLSSDLFRLFTLLRERRVSYLLVGGIALLRYVEGRNTEDIDLVLSVASLEAIPEIEVSERNADFAQGRFGSLRVDVLLASNPVFDRALKHHATTHRFHTFEVPCATVEGLIILKLYALPDLYAQGKLQRAMLYETDIAMLCQRYHPDLRALLESLRSHVAEGPYEELQRIVTEIEAKLRRIKG